MYYRPKNLDEIQGRFLETAFVITNSDVINAGLDFQTPIWCDGRLELPCVCVVDNYDGNYCLNDWTSCIYNDGNNGCSLEVVEDKE